MEYLGFGVLARMFFDPVADRVPRDSEDTRSFAEVVSSMLERGEDDLVLDLVELGAVVREVQLQGLGCADLNLQAGIALRGMYVEVSGEDHRSVAGQDRAFDHV